MLFTKPFKVGIAEGRIRISFRKWKKPKVRVGGSYLIEPLGAIKVDTLSKVKVSSITVDDAQLAGFGAPGDLIAYLGVASEEVVTRIDFHFIGVIPREPVPTIEEVYRRIQRADTRARRRGEDPWAITVLHVIAVNPGSPARVQAAKLDWETALFKSRARRLKQWGLLRSLPKGYQLTRNGGIILSLQA